MNGSAACDGSWIGFEAVAETASGLFSNGHCPDAVCPRAKGLSPSKKTRMDKITQGQCFGSRGIRLDRDFPFGCMFMVSGAVYRTRGKRGMVRLLLFLGPFFGYLLAKSCAHKFWVRNHSYAS